MGGNLAGKKLALCLFPLQDGQPREGVNFILRETAFIRCGIVYSMFYLYILCAFVLFSVCVFESPCVVTVAGS